MKRLVVLMFVFMFFCAGTVIPRVVFAHPGHGNSIDGASVSPGHYLVEPDHWPVAILCVVGCFAVASALKLALGRERKVA